MIFLRTSNYTILHRFLFGWQNTKLKSFYSVSYIFHTKSRRWKCLAQMIMYHLHKLLMRETMLNAIAHKQYELGILQQMRADKD